MLTIPVLRAALDRLLAHSPVLGQRGDAGPEDARATDATPLVEALAAHLAKQPRGRSVDAALHAFELTHARRPACYWTAGWTFEWTRPERIHLRFLLNDPADTPWDPLHSVWVELVLAAAPAAAA